MTIEAIWISKAEASRRTSEVTQSGEAVPESTIRSWTKASGSRSFVVRVDGRGRVHWDDVAKLAKKYAPRANKQPKKPSEKITAAQFATINGVAINTVYDWMKRGLISEYTTTEAARMVIERKSMQSGKGLTEQAEERRGRDDAEELGLELADHGSATSGQVRAVDLKLRQVALARALGEAYAVDKVVPIVESIVNTYRDALNRGAHQVRRAVQATLDQHAIDLPPTAYDELMGTVQGILDDRAIDARKELRRARDE